MNSILLWILVMTIINGLLAFAGAIFYIIFRKKIKKLLIFLVSFTTGALLGGAFFHFIPESLEELSITQTLFITLIGFFGFFIIEKFLHWHHCHEQIPRHRSQYRPGTR